MEQVQKEKIKLLYAQGQKRYVAKNTAIGTLVSLLTLYFLNLASEVLFHYQFVSRVYMFSATFFMPVIISAGYTKNWNKIETQYLAIIDEEKNGPLPQTNIDRILSEYE